ncbi:MAG: response regulator transcription factor [Planctomycetota bacterium]
MKLLIADDHTLFRDALVQYIKRASPNMHVDLAEDLYAVQKFLKNKSRFDLILLDFRMPGMNGLQGLEQIRTDYPTMRVALMSGVAESHHVQKALDLGACAYFPKTLSGKALLKGIQDVLSGQRFIPQDENSESVMPSYYDDSSFAVYKNVNDKNLHNGAVEAIDDLRLTPRELDVLTFLMKGASNKEIARELDLKEVTVKLHVRGICKKLGAKNRTQAAVIAKDMSLSLKTSA